MANGTTRTPEKDAKFLERLSRGASVSAAAKGAGYARRSLYRWRAADAELAAAWDDALEVDTDLLEDEALRRALHGAAAPRFHEGVCGTVQKYSDTLLIFLLKARRPEKYSGKAGQHLSGHLEVEWMVSGRSGAAPARRLHATGA
jgi:hypothetical protein